MTERAQLDASYRKDQDRAGRPEGRRELKQEAQANQFAISLLAPFQHVDGLLSSDLDLRDAQRLRDQLDISLEASLRRMIDRRDEDLAAVWSKDGRVVAICDRVEDIWREQCEVCLTSDNQGNFGTSICFL